MPRIFCGTKKNGFTALLPMAVDLCLSYHRPMPVIERLLSLTMCPDSRIGKAKDYNQSIRLRVILAKLCGQKGHKARKCPERGLPTLWMNRKCSVPRVIKWLQKIRREKKNIARTDKHCSNKSERPRVISYKICSEKSHRDAWNVFAKISGEKEMFRSAKGRWKIQLLSQSMSTVI